MNLEAMIEQMLAEFNPRDGVGHSYVDYHAKGLDYLCLHRSNKLTVKLYLLERPTNTNDGYLVAPHSHRYAFDSVVLLGKVDHLRFEAELGDAYDQCDFDGPNRKTTWNNNRWNLIPTAVEHYTEGCTYRVQPWEVHTLRMLDHREPLVLGLVQYVDVKEHNKLYVPAHRNREIKYANTRLMDLEEIKWATDRCRMLTLK